MIRTRRLRLTPFLRDLTSEYRVTVNDLVMPFFVVEGQKKKEAIPSLPGIYRYSPDKLVEEVEKIHLEKGIKAIILFEVSRNKDKTATASRQENGVIPRVISLLKKKFPHLVIITDICLCTYTSHGHCSILTEEPKQRKKKNLPDTVATDNDATIEVLAKMALSHAKAGADFVAPSAMMDGQVGAIRKRLDTHGLTYTGILAYSAKYASHFYGPFREAMQSAPGHGNRKSYQMDFRNSREAIREIQADIQEGADIVMVKPALAYLDIIQRVKSSISQPVAAYNVSGEYSLVHHYKNGDREVLIYEIATAIKRAGADLIITYHAAELADILNATYQNLQEKRE